MVDLKEKANIAAYEVLVKNVEKITGNLDKNTTLDARLGRREMNKVVDKISAATKESYTQAMQKNFEAKLSGVTKASYQSPPVSPSSSRSNSPRNSSPTR